MLLRLNVRSLQPVACSLASCLRTQHAPSLLGPSLFSRNKSSRNRLKGKSRSIPTPQLHALRDDRSPLNTDLLIKAYQQVAKDFENSINRMHGDIVLTFAQQTLGRTRVPPDDKPLSSLARVMFTKEDILAVTCYKSENFQRVLDVLSAAKEFTVIDQNDNTIYVEKLPGTALQKSFFMRRVLAKEQDAQKELVRLRSDSIRWSRRTIIEHAKEVQIERIVHAQYKVYRDEVKEIHAQSKKVFAQ